MLATTANSSTLPQPPDRAFRNKERSTSRTIMGSSAGRSEQSKQANKNDNDAGDKEAGPLPDAYKSFLDNMSFKISRYLDDDSKAGREEKKEKENDSAHQTSASFCPKCKRPQRRPASSSAKGAADAQASEKQCQCS